MGAHYRPHTPAKGEQNLKQTKRIKFSTKPTPKTNKMSIFEWCILTRKFVVHFNPQNDTYCRLDGQQLSGE